MTQAPISNADLSQWRVMLVTAQLMGVTDDEFDLDASAKYLRDAFANHAAAAVAEERAKVVKWMRYGSVPDHDDTDSCPFDKAAAMIERADHLKEQTRHD